MTDDASLLDSQLHIGPRTGGIGARRIALLEAIGAAGSITAAAKSVGLSYKGAWDAVNAINNLADRPLVQGSTGGAGGGGTQLPTVANGWYVPIVPPKKNRPDFLSNSTVAWCISPTTST